MPPALVVENVCKSFAIARGGAATVRELVTEPFRSRDEFTLPVLEDLSFSVDQGEFFGIVGRNGSGKSTLLKCIAGIYTLAGGRIGIRGRLSPFIDLGAGFDSELTGRENAITGAMLLGLSRRQAHRRADSILEFAELGDFGNHELKNYSSGMVIRLGFGIVMHVDADILLLDEVLAVGDAGFAEKCAVEFERMRSEGRTIVFVSHDMESIERFCDRALLLDHGRIAALGDPATVAHAYRELNATPPSPAPYAETSR